MATRFLAGMLRRDAVTSPDAAKFFMTHVTNPHPTIRAYAQRYDHNFLVCHVDRV